MSRAKDNRTNLAVATLRLKNFKAVRDSRVIRFTPLTVLIGNNGAGKSSLIEGLETLKSLAIDGLDEAMQRWYGFEYAWNRAASHPLRQTQGGKQYQTNPMIFEIRGAAQEGAGENPGIRNFQGSSEITAGPGTNEVFFFREELIQSREGKPTRTVTRSINSLVYDTMEGYAQIREPLSPNQSVFHAEPSLALWQFVRLNPEAMVDPKPLHRVGGYLPLAPDGSNIAEYLLDIRGQDPNIIDGIIETIQVILPYVQEVQPVITSEIGRSVYLQLWEQKFNLPGWLFSTGTLRLVALLALLRHPEPPPLIVIEELENGLDPRTIGLIVEEIREVVRSGRSQIVVTTHSPYLLDLLPLSSLIFVERVNGQPRFFRPDDDESVRRWSQDFAPGRLYTMGRFRKSQ